MARTQPGRLTAEPFHFDSCQGFVEHRNACWALCSEVDAGFHRACQCKRHLLLKESKRLLPPSSHLEIKPSVSLETEILLSLVKCRSPWHISYAFSFFLSSFSILAVAENNFMKACFSFKDYIKFRVLMQIKTWTLNQLNNAAPYQQNPHYQISHTICFYHNRQFLLPAFVCGRLAISTHGKCIEY